MSVCLSALFRAPWESAELHSLRWHTGCVTTSNPRPTVGGGGHGGMNNRVRGGSKLRKKGVIRNREAKV